MRLSYILVSFALFVTVFVNQSDSICENGRAWFKAKRTESMGQRGTDPGRYFHTHSVQYLYKDTFR